MSTPKRSAQPRQHQRGPIGRKRWEYPNGAIVLRKEVGPVKPDRVLVLSLNPASVQQMRDHLTVRFIATRNMHLQDRLDAMFDFFGLNFTPAKRRGKAK